MARLHAVDGIPARTIEGPWSLVVTAPGACAGPGEAASLPGWISAEVPGTAAVAPAR